MCRSPSTLSAVSKSLAISSPVFAHPAAFELQALYLVDLAESGDELVAELLRSVSASLRHLSIQAVSTSADITTCPPLRMLRVLDALQACRHLVYLHLGMLDLCHDTAGYLLNLSATIKHLELLDVQNFCISRLMTRFRSPTFLPDIESLKFRSAEGWLDQDGDYYDAPAPSTEDEQELAAYRPACTLGLPQRDLWCRTESRGFFHVVLDAERA